MVGNVLYVSHFDQLGELLDQVGNRGRLPRDDDCEECLVGVEANCEGLDVGPSAGKDTGYAVDDAGFVGNKHADGVFFHALLQWCWLVDIHIIALLLLRGGGARGGMLAQ